MTIWKPDISLVLECIWIPSCYKLVTRSRFYWFIQYWIGGSTSCPSHQIFILTPNTFFVLTKVFHIRGLLIVLLAPFSSVETNAIIPLNNKTTFHIWILGLSGIWIHTVSSNDVINWIHLTLDIKLFYTRQKMFHIK